MEICCYLLLGAHLFPVSSCPKSIARNLSWKTRVGLLDRRKLTMSMVNLSFLKVDNYWENGIEGGFKVAHRFMIPGLKISCPWEVLEKIGISWCSFPGIYVRTCKPNMPKRVLIRGKSER